MRLFYPQPKPRASWYQWNDFEWRSDLGEGQGDGCRIMAAGTNNYRVLRPKFPLPAHDGLQFQVQARVRSRLTLEGSNQGFGLQVRGIKWGGGTSERVQKFVHDPDRDGGVGWYGRQDPGFVFVTETVKIPPGAGVTHLLIEPLVHAQAGTYCDVSSVRLRTMYHELYEHDSPGQNLTSLATGQNHHYKYLYTLDIPIAPGQELRPVIDCEVELGRGAFTVFAGLIFRRAINSTYTNPQIFANAGSPIYADTPSPLIGENVIIASERYDQIQLVLDAVTLDRPASASDFFSRNLHFELHLKDIIKSGF